MPRRARKSNNTTVKFALVTAGWRCVGVGLGWMRVGFRLLVYVILLSNIRVLVVAGSGEFQANPFLLLSFSSSFPTCW